MVRSKRTDRYNGQVIVMDRKWEMQTNRKSFGTLKSDRYTGDRYGRVAATTGFTVFDWQMPNKYFK